MAPVPGNRFAACLLGERSAARDELLVPAGLRKSQHGPHRFGDAFNPLALATLSLLKCVVSELRGIARPCVTRDLTISLMPCNLMIASSYIETFMQYLTRLIEPSLKEAASTFKAVLILGARQVGKSTLLQHLFPDIKRIVFDPLQDLYGARRDPDLFLDSFPAPLILDEVQYVPELLPALKRRMDESNQRGQYFLTGSQNFSVLKTVAESMAGRVAIYNLDTLTLQEIEGRGSSPSFLSQYLGNPKQVFESPILPALPTRSLVDFLFRGSYPDACSLPLSQVTRYLRSYLQTYVDRDVRSQEEIRQWAEFDRFLGLAAALTGQEINASQLGRDIGVTPQTSRRWLDLLMFSYQWMELPAFHGNTIKRLSSKRKGYFKDSGLACYLQRLESPESLATSPRFGAIFETWCVNMLMAHANSMEVSPVAYHWRTAAGAEVDLVFERGGKLYPIEMKSSSRLGSHDLSGMRALRATYPDRETAPGLVIYAGRDFFRLDDQTLAVPWFAL